MSNKLPVSVFIIAKNEETRIGASIKSVIDLVDEVIVIDSGSIDNTVELSKSLGATVVFNHWQGYVLQKIFGEKLCKNNWILNIDADEAITRELAEEIRSLFAKQAEPAYKAYMCRMVIVHRLDPVLKPMAPVTKAIRFYHKEYAGFAYGDLNSLCHDSVLLRNQDEAVGKLSSAILHNSLRSISQAVEKANFYSGLQAEELVASGRKPSNLRIMTEPLWWFLKAFLLRRYFVYGFNGLVDSMIFAFARFLRLAKAREEWLQRGCSRHHDPH